ncbi:hypothetical protein [Streptomyces resistomycificus]|uniref:Uncharacterized protein n=1 Tax=Streptomyces resistomycificus TaxID=67356 RepID=A0A0L8L5F5_9ACTN|nr:hypothetical protein [Streptomyces resistomycificus]KOG33301.1 hypothetical protein ADK37_23260 [Streptomyces resistomycificus]KUN99505.1 hypothetical protein AQJ84_11195 [Streptomyces resistomycificus]
MPNLPEPKPSAPAAGQAANPLTEAVIQAAVDNAIHEMRRDSTTPPARKPERPAMSEKATDDSVRMIAFGGMTLMVSAGGGILMIASDFANPTVIGMICAAPAAFALPILALARLAKGAKPEPEIHQHYTGPVHQDQRNVQTKNSGVWVKNTNE